MDTTASVEYGTHMPALIKAVGASSGPILECGGGLYSTPFLHFACYETRRPILTLETDPEFFEWLRPFESDYHQIRLITDWAGTDISGPWSVALVDHNPTGRRKEEIKRLANTTDYIVVHDTNPRLEGKYKYSEVYPLFKYRRDFTREKPHTAILSNFYPLENL